MEDKKHNIEILKKQIKTITIGKIKGGHHLLKYLGETSINDRDQTTLLGGSISWETLEEFQINDYHYSFQTPWKWAIFSRTLFPSYRIVYYKSGKNSSWYKIIYVNDNKERVVNKINQIKNAQTSIDNLLLEKRNQLELLKTELSILERNEDERKKQKQEEEERSKREKKEYEEKMKSYKLGSEKARYYLSDIITSTLRYSNYIPAAAGIENPKEDILKSPFGVYEYMARLECTVEVYLRAIKGAKIKYNDDKEIQKRKAEKEERKRKREREDQHQKEKREQLKLQMQKNEENRRLNFQRDIERNKIRLENDKFQFEVQKQEHVQKKERAEYNLKYQNQMFEQHYKNKK